MSPDDDMAEHWEAHAKMWDRDEQAHFFANQAFASLLEQVDLHQDVDKRRRVLDFGCGTGLLTEKLAPLVRGVVAVDTSPAMLNVLRNKHLENVDIHCANIDDDSVRSAARWFGDFDLIVASSVCSFLPSYETTLGVLAQALNPSGVFVQWDWLLDHEVDDDDGLTIDRVRTACTKAGLRCDHVARAFSVLFDAEPSPVLIGVASKNADG
jgi:predicted TPR repeat methyltransferase